MGQKHRIFQFETDMTELAIQTINRKYRYQFKISVVNFGLDLPTHQAIQLVQLEMKPWVKIAKMTV